MYRYSTKVGVWRNRSKSDGNMRHTGARGTQRNYRGSLAEFGPALLLFLATTLVPAFLLLKLGMSAAAMNFIVDHAAQTAANASSYESALSRSSEVLRELTSSPLGKLAGLNPDRLSQICISIREHATSTDVVKTFTREQLKQMKVDLSVNSYEYEVYCRYSVEPVISGTSFQWLRDVPLLNAPLTLSVRAARAIEYPDELEPGELD